VTINIEKMRSDMRWEARKFLVPRFSPPPRVICAHREPPSPIVIQLPALAK